MSEQKPTVVLVHGAFADSSSWNGVIEKLQSHGHPRGVREQPAARPEQDSDYVRQLVESLPGPVVLVGHSYGGSVISNAARGLDRSGSSSSSPPSCPTKGRARSTCPGSSRAAPPGDAPPRARSPSPTAAGRDLYIEEGKFHQQFAADVPETAAAVMARPPQRPQCADAALAEGASAPAWRDVLLSWVTRGDGGPQHPGAGADLHRPNARRPRS
ncbi:alpha/beta fold hydrolase [Streptomyces sp. KL116D]|uniref:alpha/beta hydrolase n=1 Tax=Streptomyces sp. KL116D TaxID=3045152 RepID=UPI0035584946